MRWIASSLAVGLFVSLAAAPALADTINLKNGRTISGRVVDRSSTSVVVEFDGGKGTIVIPRSAVASMDDEAAAAPLASARTDLGTPPATPGASGEKAERIARILAEAKGTVVVRDGVSGRMATPALPGDVPGTQERIARLLAESQGHIRVTFDDTARAWPKVQSQPSEHTGKILIRTTEDDEEAPLQPVHVKRSAVRPVRSESPSPSLPSFSLAPITDRAASVIAAVTSGASHVATTVLGALSPSTPPTTVPATVTKDAAKAPEGEKALAPALEATKAPAATPAATPAPATTSAPTTSTPTTTAPTTSTPTTTAATPTPDLSGDPQDPLTSAPPLSPAKSVDK